MEKTHFGQHDDCFGCKVQGIQFGAGVKTFPKNYYDSQAVEYTFGGPEAQEEYIDRMEGLPLKWRTENGHRVPYKKDKVGDWTRATEKDMDRVMYGSSKRAEKISREDVG